MNQCGGLDTRALLVWQLYKCNRPTLKGVLQLPLHQERERERDKDTILCFSLSQCNMSYNLPSEAATPDSTLSYQSLFPADAEFPRFRVSYRWWEDEAMAMLWAFDIPEMSRVIRYGFFQDENYPRSSLLTRNSETIDAFLSALSDPSDHQLLVNLSHFQRVEEILRRSRVLPFQPMPWGWFPPPPGRALDARTIADDMDAESHVHFSRLAFEEIVRASLGYHAASVEWFLLQHTALYIHLLDHLQKYPEDTALYIEVEKVCYSPAPSRESPQLTLTLPLVRALSASAVS